MRVVIQRVSQASVSVNQKVTGAIENGLLVLVGFSHEESQEEMQWMANKMVNLRIFGDENGVMNLSVQEVQGEILLVSQFTLMASTKKGNRPSYIEAAKPEVAKKHYENFIQILQSNIDNSIKLGIFGADMNVQLVNDGPVTICMDSKAKI